MPFVSAQRPSLQLGLLKGLAERAGAEAITFHLNLELAATTGIASYEALSRHRGSLFGDWLFAAEAFGDDEPDPQDTFARDFAAALGPLLTQAGWSAEDYVSARRTLVPDYLDRMERLADWRSFDLVGFTSTFQQTAASLALARRLKRLAPGLRIVFGGANCEGEMGLELLRSCEAIDFVVVGEGDEAFPELLGALSTGRDPGAIPSVAMRRENGEIAFAGSRPPFQGLDELPLPDYDEYFTRAERLGLLAPSGRREIDLPFESSRGCWWGQKHHCTFCGLNGAFMGFRSKSAERVADELATLARRYRSFHFEAVDNIADHQYLQTLFPALAAAGTSYRLFYEVKSNLGRDQVRGLWQAGLRRIQPGIESLSTPVLKLMRKGVTAIQNVNLMRWARHYGISVGWNLIYGFPGETQEHYAGQARLLPSLRHLDPPGGIGRIWMERFSPIFHDRASFPAERVAPEASYRYVYPRAVDLSKVAYFFDYAFAGSLPDEAYAELATEVARWQERWRQPPSPKLGLWRAPGLIQVDDLRDSERPGTHTFTDALAAVYLACMDAPITAAQAAAAAGLDDVDDVGMALDGFVERTLMMREGPLYLALALPERHAE